MRSATGYPCPMDSNTVSAPSRRRGNASFRALDVVSRLLVASAASFLTSLAVACTSIPGDEPPPSSDLLWTLPVTDGMTQLPNSCTAAVESAVRAFVARPALRIEIIAYADSLGSASLGLARISSLASLLHGALLQRSPRMKIRIETRLWPTLDANPGTPAMGRIILRVPGRAF